AEVGGAGAAGVGGDDRRARRVVFDAGETTAGFAQPEPYPDGAVTVRAADFERAPGAARDDHHAEEPAVLLGDRELIPIELPDLLEHRQLMRRLRQHGLLS